MIQPSLALLVCSLLPISRSVASQARLQVTERGGTRLIVDETGQLHRVTKEGVRKAIACTLTEGPGVIHDIVRDPRGGSFVAAEKGLFIISSDVDVLDPCDLRDGVPAGVPNKLRCEGDGRLFVKTRTGFGVIDTSFFFGRSFAWGSGVRDYAVDEGPRPTMRVVMVDREAHEPGRIYKADSGTRVAIACRGEARGGATYRYRRHGHHLWYPLDRENDFSLPIARPGKTAFDIMAFDQDLRRSPVVVLRFEAPYPAWFSKAFLLGAAGSFSLIVLISFAFIAWVNGAGRKRLIQAALSSIAVVLLGIQILTAIFPHAKGWPFVGFSMYTEKYEEFALLYQPGLWAESLDGTWFPTYPGAAGRGSDGYWQGLVPLVHGGDTVVEAFLEDYNERHPERPIRGLMVQETRARLTSGGPVRVAPVVMMRYHGKGR